MAHMNTSFYTHQSFETRAFVVSDNYTPLEDRDIPELTNDSPVIMSFSSEHTDQFSSPSTPIEATSWSDSSATQDLTTPITPQSQDGLSCDSAWSTDFLPDGHWTRGNLMPTAYLQPGMYTTGMPFANRGFFQPHCHPTFVNTVTERNDELDGMMNGALGGCYRQSVDGSESFLSVQPDPRMIPQPWCVSHNEERSPSHHSPSQLKQSRNRRATRACSKSGKSSAVRALQFQPADSNIHSHDVGGTIVDLPKIPVRDHHCQEHNCGKSFARAEHLKRHERMHGLRPEKRTFPCALCKYFGEWICKKGKSGKPISERSDNLSQHLATHCYGNSANSSRNSQVSMRVMEAVMRRTSEDASKIDAKVESMKMTLSNNLKRNRNSTGKGRIDKDWEPKWNAHIDHDMLSELFPNGFVSCRDFGSKARTPTDEDRELYGCIDDKLPWCRVWLHDGPKANEPPRPIPCRGVCGHSPVQSSARRTKNGMVKRGGVGAKSRL